LNETSAYVDDLHRCHAGQRRNAAGSRIDVEPVQHGGDVVRIPIGGEHHMVLIQLREDGRHLPLAERVIEHIVDGLRRHAQARRRIAVERQLDLVALLRSLALHIGENRILFQRRDQLAGP